jgi:hypothetical protein
MPPGTDAELKKRLEKIQEKLDALEGQTDAGIRKETMEQLESMVEAAKDYRNTMSSVDPVLDKQLKDLEKTNNSLSAIVLTNKGITRTFKDMAKESRDFAFSTEKWFAKGEEIAKVYLGVSKNIGLSGKRSQLLTKSFQDSASEAIRLGVKLSDMDDIYQNFAEASGRARVLSEKEAENIAKLAAGTGMFVGDASKMAEQFDLMGLSSEKVFGPDGYINQAIGDSQKMGLNANKVIGVLEKNLSSMQKYSFSNGVKGMVEMSKLAVKMRVDVSEMLGMADKFYHPEAAIEAAANLQLLGGDIAKAFGDPFTVMYEARNKPEELAKRVGKMTENMVSFNEQTGEFDFPAEARMQLQSVSKELGIGMDSLTDMTRQMSKIKSIKMKVSGAVVDDESRDAIAGLARMEDGEWKVDFIDDQGKKQTKAIDDLTQAQAELALGQQKDFDDKSEKDFLRDIALNTQTFSEKVALQQESRQVGLAAQTGVYEATMEGFLDETVTAYDNFQKDLFTTIQEGIAGEEGGSGAVMRKAFGVDEGGENALVEGMRVAYGNMIGSMNESIDSGEFNVDSMTSKVTDADIFLGGVFGGKDDVRFDTGGKTMVSGPAGTFTINDLDEYYGKDGAFIAGTNLGVDKKVNSVNTSAVAGNSTVTHKGRVRINVDVKSDNKSLDISNMEDTITKTVSNMFLNGRGSIDGNNTSKSNSVMVGGGSL